MSDGSNLEKNIFFKVYLQSVSRAQLEYMTSEYIIQDGESVDGRNHPFIDANFCFYIH